MSRTFAHGAKLLHVTNIGSILHQTVIRPVSVQFEPGKLDMHVRCWIPSTNSSQMLPTFELYPDTENVKAELVAIQEATELLRIQERTLMGRCYELRNRIARGEI